MEASKWLKRNMMKISKQLGMKSYEIEDKFIGIAATNRKWET